MATSALQFSHVTLGYENIITTSDRRAIISVSSGKTALEKARS